MTLYLLLGLGSAALALVLTPLVGRASALLGLVDAPGGRKVHTHSIPRTGGLAVAAAAVLALAAGFLLLPEMRAPNAWAALRPLVFSGAVIFLLGLLDDVYGLGPGAKVSVELVAAFMLMASGLLIERVTLFGSTWTLGWLALPVTTVWLVGMTNAFNLIDGVDGLAPGIAALAGGACGAILIARGHMPEAMLLAAFVGAMLGFLVYNFEPASIFLGDSGSLLAGFLLAATAISGWQKGATALATAVPLLIFALPIADAALTLMRRSVSGSRGGQSVTETLRHIARPDREHIHHRLLASGWSVRRTVITLYVVTAVLSLLALASADIQSR